MTALQRDPVRRFQNAGELERRLLTYVIGATRAPEDTDVGRFVRALFPDEAAAEEDTEPAAPLQLVSAARADCGSALPRPRRAAGATADADGRRGAPPPADGAVGRAAVEDEAFAPTRTPASRQLLRRHRAGAGRAR